MLGVDVGFGEPTLDFRFGEVHGSEDFLMDGKPTYEELERRVKELDRESLEAKQIDALLRIQCDLGIALSSI
jgi:hypothetical protein